jgi:hypothetical protein
MSSGIVATDGATLRISGISITINKTTGEVKIEGGEPSIHYDVCPVWLSIAIEHLEDAKLAREDMIRTKDAADPELKFKALEREFRASMQAIVSSAIAFDALYAVVKRNLSPIPSSFDPAKKGSARHAQVSEAIKQAFQLKPKDCERVRDAIKQIFGLRDQSVHPTGNFNAPTLHPQLQIGVEQRQVIFRYENALEVVRYAVAMISELATKGTPKNESLKQYANDLQGRMRKIRTVPLLGLPALESS